jgi:hypothetical protein
MREYPPLAHVSAAAASTPSSRLPFCASCIPLEGACAVGRRRAPPLPRAAVPAAAEQDHTIVAPMMKAASGHSLSIVRTHLQHPHAHALVQTARHSIAPLTLGFQTQNDNKITSIEVVHIYVYRALVVTLSLGCEPAQGRSRYSWARRTSCRKCPPRLLQTRRCELHTVEAAAFARLHQKMQNHNSR